MPSNELLLSRTFDYLAEKNWPLSFNTFSLSVAVSLKKNQQICNGVSRENCNFNFPLWLYSLFRSINGSRNAFQFFDYFHLKFSSSSSRIFIIDIVLCGFALCVRVGSIFGHKFDDKPPIKTKVLIKRNAFVQW